jgi:hypothetical protein
MKIGGWRGKAKKEGKLTGGKRTEKEREVSFHSEIGQGLMSTKRGGDRLWTKASSVLLVV